MRHLLTVLILSLTALAQINNPGSGGGGGNPGPGQGAWQIQTTSCGSNATCTQINGDAQVVIDATVSNTSTTITCPNSDCNFTAGDVGKSAWAVQRGGVYPFTGGTLICGNSVPVPTISTVNNAQSVTLTGSNCTANVTGAAIFVWGHKDGATLHAMTPGCLPIYGPNGVNIIVDDTFLTAIPTCASSSGITGATGVPQPSFYGVGTGTNWIISPDFNWAHCNGAGAQTPVCIGSGLGQIWNLVLWGTGYSNATTTNCANSAGKTMLAHNPAGGALYFVNLSGICWGSTLTGVELNALDDQWNEGGVQNVGLTGLIVSSKGVNTQSLDNLEGASSGISNNDIGTNVLAAGQLNDYGSYLIACAVVSGKLASRNTHYTNGTGSGGSAPCQNAITVNSGGSFYSDGDFVNQDGGGNVGLNIASGGFHVSRNTVYGATGGSAVAVVSSGTFIDQGGNTISAGAVQTANAKTNISGTQVYTGTCTGTATSSATLGLYGQLGQAATTTCTSTTNTLGTVMFRSGTIQNLSVQATHAGVNASSGVFTVMKNGATTTSTCTIGTGTACQDATHTVAFVAGDIIGIQFTTQGTEVLAGITAQVVAW